jgi:hypothetical protein
LTESANGETQKIDLTARLRDLDEQRLAQLTDPELVAVINQRRYFADLHQQEQWKKRKLKFQKKLRFKRPQKF